MDTKLVVLMLAVGAASASLVPFGAPAPLLAGPPLARVAPVDPLPQYSFGYDVQDALTGDYKNHQEQRNGDLVQGSYSVVDPDGTRRIVDYSADSLNGFNAVVRREPLVVAAPPRVLAAGPPVAQFAAPVAQFAPPVARFAAPQFAAPLAYPAF